jgi:hypothetical protein
MAGRPTAFNTTVLRAIVREIRRGAFDWVAAEAAGIDRKTFYRWMKRGEQGEEPFAELKAQVDQARARTRIGAEQRVRDEHPLSWLRLGPGRERKGQPGWTEAVEALSNSEPEELEEEEPGVMEAIAEALREVGWKEEAER